MKNNWKDFMVELLLGFVCLIFALAFIIVLATWLGGW